MNNKQQIYSDGTIEERVLQYLKAQRGDSDKILEDISEGAVFHNFTSARAGLIQWYPFKADASILEIGAGMGSLTPTLSTLCRKITAIEPSPVRAQIIEERCRGCQNVTVVTADIHEFRPTEQFDYVLLIGVLEYAGISADGENPWREMLCEAKRLLKPAGKLLVAIENKFGLKYWCGAAEDHTGIPFDSLNDYSMSHGRTGRYSGKKGVRTFSQEGLRELLEQSGFPYTDFYYPLPDYKFPEVVLHKKTDDAAGFTQGIKFNYPEESKLIAKEQRLYPEVVKNNCLGFFANSFLVEASAVPADETDIVAVLLKRDYREEYRLMTTIRETSVERRAIGSKAKEHLCQLIQNTELLQKRGIACVPQSALHDGVTTAERIVAPRADSVFAEAFSNGDQNLMVRMVEQLRSSLLKSSELHEKDGELVLKEGFVDLTFRNSFWINGSLVFFDQEWVCPDIPLSFLLYRSIRYAFPENAESEQMRKVYQYCGISEEDESAFASNEKEFLESLMDPTNCKWFDQTMYQERLTLAEKESALVANKSAHIELLLQSERDLTAKVRERDAALVQQAAELEEKDAVLSQQAAVLAEKEQIIRNKEGHIELLLESDRELERIKNSRSWRWVMMPLWKLSGGLAPAGSKRRLLAKMAVKFIKHPIRFLSNCSPDHIKKFFRTLKREGTAGVSRRLDDCMIGRDIPSQKLILEAVPERAEDAAVKTAADYAPLCAPTWEIPTVSIVIPVYNQFDYTYACVKSILQNSGDVSYEILIADDCSTDVTREIDRVITGLHTIRNPENLRFLRNCNHAAKSARGKYILFLNNDTQVQPNWLAPLVDLMENDETIGMTGSKLVFPDGRLQEAGGILWKDGSAWNYGNRSDPADPEFNYVKDVDYISGASICIRKELWEEIGGFDERFAPAYCEDSDLAFEVRKHGRRVVYQPASVVVHFEGVSNGTDTSTGQKQYQVINQKKFYEKWKDVLEQEHFSNAQNVFQARDRSRNKKVLLMVDHYVPQFDKDAGSRTVYQYIRLFASQGFQVKFIGDNFFPHQPYTQVLQQMGVEVLYGPYYASHWKDWLKENGACIQYAFLNRPHISVKYIDLVRQYTPARIIYYGHDLHFLRERREYELTGQKDLLKSSEDWKKKELELMRKADWAYYPSCVEEEEIHKIAPDVHVKAIPAYLFTEVEDKPFQAEGRKDLMFIGGFSHRPNVDAVKWFAAEIMPHLRKLLPDVVVHILGSNPPEDVKALADEQLKIAGFVTDEQLEEYYSRCRLDIVPLRYGAGIKGKVVEAMRYGMPVVTTQIGAEGIAQADEILSVADNAEEFAKRVAALYQNPEELDARSAASRQYIREHFSPENAVRVIGSEFDMGPERSTR